MLVACRTVGAEAARVVGGGGEAVAQLLGGHLAGFARVTLRTWRAAGITGIALVPLIAFLALNPLGTLLALRAGARQTRN